MSFDAIPNKETALTFRENAALKMLKEALDKELGQDFVCYGKQ